MLARLRERAAIVIQRRQMMMEELMQIEAEEAELLISMRDVERKYGLVRELY